MPQYTIDNLDFYLHPLQNVLLFSTKNPITIERISSVVQTIAQNKEQYKIQDPEMPFDVLVRQHNQLFSYNFDDEGKLNTDEEKRGLDEDGLFHFQFAPTDHLLEQFEAGHDEFFIDKITNPNLNDPSKDELSNFIKSNFLRHFNDWDLTNEAVSSSAVREHIAMLASAANNLYIIRDRNNNIAAVVGMSMTSDEQLAFQSITVTKENLREKGLMAAALQRISNDIPNAVLTAYVVNSKIRTALGETAITQLNSSNAISAAKSDFLNTVFVQRGITLSSSHSPRM